MLGLLRSNPKKKLEKKHAKLLERARDLQRGGDIPGYARLMDEAEQVAREIDQLDSQ